MKAVSLLLYGSCISLSLAAQDPITTVENGLTKNEPVLPEIPLQKFTIWDRMKTHHVNGVSIAVINDGKTAWLKTYGIKDAGNPGDSVTTATLFQLASIGKIITALAALRLVREGKIGLDENVNDKLSSWKVPDNEWTAQKKVTLRNLLSHSAGFTDDYGFEGYYPNKPLPSTVQVLNAEKPANNRKRLQPNTVPGSRERYSGGGYIIIQQLIEDITHTSFGHYVDSLIFKRLGMNNTTYDYYPDVSMGKPVARGHYANGKPDARRKYSVYPEAAAAGPWTTPEDVATLLTEIQREANGVSELMLDSVLAKEMLTPQINVMGLGPHLAGIEKPMAFWHSGNNAGYVCLAYGMIGKGQGAVVMTNSDQGEWLSLEIMRSIANAYSWPVMQNKTLRVFTADSCLKYLGDYQTADPVQMTIRQSGSVLTLINGGQNYNLLPLADGSFTIGKAEDRVRLVFGENKKGEVTGFTILQNGGKNNASLVKMPTAGK